MPAFGPGGEVFRMPFGVEPTDALRAAALEHVNVAGVLIDRDRLRSFSRPSRSVAFATGCFGGCCPGLTRLESIVATNCGEPPGLTT